MRDLFNLANLLSFARIFLAIPLAFFIKDININSGADDIVNVVAICLLIAITDVFDGFLARTFNTVSNFGKMLDPIADKICILVLIVFLSIKFGNIFLFLFLFLLVRDLIISFLSIYSLKVKNQVFQSNVFGKIFIFCISMSMLLFIVDIPDVINIAYIYEIKWFLYIMSWIFVVFSTINYFKEYIKHFRV